jgi:putative DNA primase/helicase
MSSIPESETPSEDLSVVVTDISATSAEIVPFRNDLSRCVAEPAALGAAGVDGLVRLGCSVGDIGSYARRNSVSRGRLFRAVGHLSPAELPEALESFNRHTNDRALAGIKIAAGQREIDLVFFGHSEATNEFQRILDEVEQAGGTVSLKMDFVKRVASLLNETGLPLSSLKRALVERGAKDGPLTQLFFDLLPDWDGDEGATDVALAQRFVARFGHELRYVPGLVWHVWDGTRWRSDALGDVRELAKTMGKAWRDDAQIILTTLRLTSDEDERKAIRKRALCATNIGTKCESRSGIETTIKLAETIPDIAVEVKTLDANPWLLNVRNGTIDLQNGELRSHDRSDLITKIIPVDYRPDARSPIFDGFMAQTTGGDAELAAYIQRAVGYTITGAPSEEVLFFLFGPAASGKSTFVEAVRVALGDYAKTSDFETFLKKKGDAAIRNDIARLRGARLVSSIEVDEGKELAAGLIKTITGGDMVSARLLYREFFEFKPTCTLWLVANDPPEIDGTDTGLGRRIRVIPFPHKVATEDRDPNLKKFLNDPDLAGPAVLAWMVKGCQEYLRKRREDGQGLGTCPAIETATAEYTESMDVVGRFIEDRCVVDAGAWVVTSELFASYLSWALLNGELPPLTQKAMALRLRKKGFEPKKLKGGRGWTGLRVRPSFPADLWSQVSDVSTRPALLLARNP